MALIKCLLIHYSFISYPLSSQAVIIAVPNILKGSKEIQYNS